MKKAIFYIIISLAVCILFAFLYAAYQYYTPPTERASYQMRQHNDNLRIAYIGDSWAFIHKRKHQCLINNIIEDSCHVQTRIYSYGLSGRTSKEIYEAIFDDEELRQMLQNYKYDYCIVSAGINDANKKMSIKYYQKSMDCIIRYLLSNHVRPIILEIPDYDIQKIFRWERKDRKILRRLSMVINRVPMDCKKAFRKALAELIHDTEYQDKVSIIRYKAWNSHYEEDQKKLYLIDGVHLNEYGNHVLDSVIAKEIISNISNYENRH